ncbi:MAG: type II/IV secretion system ATPase subunit [Aigarchaeota archaeon]|nr:type II/IV secretion system ATPase subunit [Aigarchaeota archaeon]MDW8092698.1 type II/IV secretion system ATPase subunit [Nitrososphaerota archaeon]
MAEKERFFGIVRRRLPRDAVTIESYWVIEPFAKVTIAIVPEENQTVYFVEEPSLTPRGLEALKEIGEVIEAELDPRELAPDDSDPQLILNKFLDRTFKKYGWLIRGLNQDELRKIRYYLSRNFNGLGHLEPILRDPKIEDISCNGVDRPIYVFHKRYESLPTNLSFESREVLNDYIVMLAHRSGKHISTAFPILDAILPGQHRIAATYGDEVTPSGGTFAIRKFRVEPFSIAELVRSGVLPSQLVAYLWLLLENKFSILIIGATGSGKTTLLNALCSLLYPTHKIVTVEETPEIYITHQNWTRLVTRESYGFTGTISSAIGLFDLVRVSLRYRPDYLIVGEVRGKEASVLFQAIATGHGGLTTVHAESVTSLVSRLTSPPMEIDQANIPLVNAVILIERTLEKFWGDIRLPVRRVKRCWEIIKHDEFNEITSFDEPSSKFNLKLEKSYHLQQMSSRIGVELNELLTELHKRALYIEWLAKSNILKIEDVTERITRYYQDPTSAFGEAVTQLEKLATASTTAISEASFAIETLLIRSGGESNLIDLLRNSRLSEEVFWRTINNLQASGRIEVEKSGRVVAKNI